MYDQNLLPTQQHSGGMRASTQFVGRQFAALLFMALLWACLVLGTVTPLSAQTDIRVTAQTLSGEEVSGQLKMLDDRQVVLTTSEGDRSFALENMLQMAPVTPVPASTDEVSVWLELIDGTQLQGTSFNNADGRGVLTVKGEEITVPTRMISHTRFRDLNDEQRSQWNDALAKVEASDLIVVRAGENLDYLDVVIEQVTDEGVTIDVDGETRDVQRERVAGIIFANKRPDLGDPVCILDAGTPVFVRQLKLDETGLRVRTQSGITLTLDPTTIAGFDFSAGKLMYLGDVEPDDMKVVKYLGPAFPLELEMHKPRRNQSPDGELITIDNTPYRKGLGIRSQTELSYRLRGAYSRFEAIAGIDDEVRGKGGHVQLVIRGDNKVLFDEPIDDARGAVPLSLDVSGVNRLTILVDFGENQGFADHLDLANARVVK